MKKLLLCLMTLFVVLTISGCKKEEKTYEYNYTATEVVEKIENDETFVVYLGTTTCSHCQAYGKLVPDYNKKYDLEIGHVVLDEVDKTDREGYDALMSILPIEYTPTTYFIIAGEMAGSVVGALDEEEIVDELIKYGFLEEGAKGNE